MSSSSPKKIKHNRIQCLKCEDIIESFHRHDFKNCKCGAIFVDGGKEYIRYGGDLKQIKDLAEYDS